MLAVVVGLSVTLAVIGGAPTSLARLTDADAIAGAFTTDVLQPPTDLAATGGSTIVLSWTPTSSAWASGYRIWRSTDAAGPYAEIADVTPRSATGASSGWKATASRPGIEELTDTWPKL